MLNKAMIMAAGVGSRLEDLSNALPKPLVPLANTAAMDILISHLESFGIKDFIANIFYKSEVLRNHYGDKNIQFVKEEELSGTAGGVKKCQFFFDEGQDFIVMSADGLCDIDIKKAYESHKNSNAIATLVLKEVESKDVPLYGIVVPDENGYVDSFQEKPRIEEAKSNLANTGIYIFNYDIFKYIPENTFYDFAKNVFPSLLENGEKINTFILDGYWSDIGSLGQYKQSNKDLLNNKVKSYIPNVVSTESGKYCCPDRVDASVNIVGDCVIGKNCKFGKNITIINSILWDNITLSDNVVVENSIVLNDVQVKDCVKDEIKTV